MLAKIESIALVGTEARLIEVEVDVGQGLPSFRVVGLPAKSVTEAEQRTRSAIVASGQRWPPHRVIANLAPGALRKEGTHFDLPIALGVMVADGHLDPEVTKDRLFVGELALDGSVRAVRGTLAAAMACRSSARRGIVCPIANSGEAALVDGIDVIGVRSLGECIAFLKGQWEPPQIEPNPSDVGFCIEDMAEVRGHESAKRAAEIAAAGGHNLLLVGAPGSGKTMLARRLPGILPRMSMEESLEVTRIYSVAGLLGEQASVVTTRPFRTPHHHTSLSGLIGGGVGLARPGEISLAHYGVLFLDELGLYRSDLLDALRAPLEDGVVRIARSGGVVSYPCRFSLAAAMNPCPCGFQGDARIACRCPARRLELYAAKLSGPLLDRFDMQVGMARLGKDALLGAPQGETSATIQARVESARAHQKQRYSSPAITNASAPKAELLRSICMDPATMSLLAGAIDSLALSGRGLNRVFRVARTIADLAGAEEVTRDHVAEALTLRVAPEITGRAA